MQSVMFHEVLEKLIHNFKAWKVECFFVFNKHHFFVKWKVEVILN
jgi:hypothetical protein